MQPLEILKTDIRYFWRLALYAVNSLSCLYILYVPIIYHITLCILFKINRGKLEIKIVHLWRKCSFRYIVLLFGLTFIVFYRYLNQPINEHPNKLYIFHKDYIRNQEYKFTVANNTVDEKQLKTRHMLNAPLYVFKRPLRPQLDFNLTVAPDEPMLQSVWHVIRLWQDDVMYVLAGAWHSKAWRHTTS